MEENENVENYFREKKLGESTETTCMPIPLFSIYAQVSKEFICRRGVGRHRHYYYYTVRAVIMCKI